MTTYQEGVGIYHTNPLTCADLGNVLAPAERQGPVRYCAPGTVGRMNTALVNWTGDTYTPDGKLDRAEIEYTTPNGRTKGLSRLFTTRTGRNVGTRTVEHWFGLTDKFGRIENRNCVPIAQRGHRICNMAGQGDRGLDARLRCFMACCLVVEGGLQRVPIWTRGNPDNAGLPYEKRFPCARLDDAIATIEALYDGELDTITADGRTPPLSLAWVQLTIEPGEFGTGWDAVCLYNHQKLGEPSEEILPDDDDE